MAKEKNWSSEEDTLLKQHYSLASKEYLCSLFPSRNWSGIKQRAYGKLKLSKLITSRTKNGDVSKLLNETPEAYYWMGFLLADGSFDKDGRLHIAVGEKDKEHLEKFASFIETTKISKNTRKSNYSDNFTFYKLSCLSTYYGPKIRTKFDLKLNKTENPPNLNLVFSNTSPDNVMALIIGFIDGDGSIGISNKGRGNNIKIEIHSSWLLNLQSIETYLYDCINEISPGTAKINKRGFSSLQITRTSLIQKLKLISSTLPCMDRKWNRITNIRIKKPKKN